MDRLTFFKSLYEQCEAAIETRLLPGGIQDFWPDDFYLDGKNLDRYCAMHADRNIYFGVATRDGDGGKKENIVEIPALWCDLDFKTTSKQEIKANLSRFPFRPSAAVFTGGGYHCYWILCEPAAASQIETIEETNRRIAAALGGDQNAVDAARILRVPGTCNVKRNALVRVVAINPFRYSIEDFTDLAPPPTKSKPALRSKGSGIDSEELLVAVFSCRFMRWCYQSQDQVREPLWYALLSNLARVSPGGVELCHRFSEKHPKYKSSETDAKILKALNAAGPHSCDYIRANGFADCIDCDSKTPFSRILKVARRQKLG